MSSPFDGVLLETGALQRSSFGDIADTSLEVYD